MHNIQITQPQRELFAQGNEHELERAINNIILPIVDRLIELGMPEGDAEYIKDIRGVAKLVLGTGVLPDRIRMKPTVVKEHYDTALLELHHPSVAERFQLLYQDGADTFFLITRGELWWTGEHLFYVHDAQSFMEYARYEVFSTSSEIREWVPKKVGRPRNEQAHIDKQGRAERYRAWIAECAAYRSMLKQKASDIRVLETQARERIAAINKEASDKIATAKAVVSDARRDLNVLKLQGAPKWTGE